MNNPQNESLQELSKQVIFLKRMIYFFLILFVLLFACILVLHTGRHVAYDSIETKKLIVKDDNGNERIIISPVITSATSRIRKDSLMGILILDEFGTDRVVVGATPTVQSAGEVVYRAENDVPYGLAFNDQHGNERGGFGYYQQRGLVSFGMDHKNREGLTFFVADESFYGQQLGMVMTSPEGGQLVYLGSDKKGNVMLNLDAPGNGRLALNIDPSAYPTLQWSDYQRNRTLSLLSPENN